jgi:cell wall-associated NlpC family hydrolase
MSARERFVEIVNSKNGFPYVYGSNGPDSFDCSGLVVFGRNKAGLVTADMTASQMFDKWHVNKKLITTCNPGDLFFYGDSNGNVNHVMICLKVWDTGTPRNGFDGIVLIGAHGGNETTTSVQKAWTKRAGVECVFGDYWQSNFIACCDHLAGEP